MRSPDGTWSLDAPVVGLDRSTALDGSAAGDVWAAGYEGLFHRNVAGVWSFVPLPTEVGQFQDIATSGTALLGLGIVSAYGEYSWWEDGALFTYDGSKWTSKAIPTHEGYWRAVDVLPDGRAVVMGDGEVIIEDGAGWATLYQVSTAGTQLYGMDIGDDGTIAAVGGEVLVGTEAGLVRQQAPKDSPWDAVWVGSASDIWMSDGKTYATTPGTLAHWNGSGWSQFSFPGEAVAAVTSDGTVVHASGFTHELVWTGGENGFAVEREGWGIGTIDALATDSHGVAWAVGVAGILARYSANSWDSEQAFDLAFDPRDLEVAGEVLVVSDGNTIMVGGSGSWTAHDVASDRSAFALAAAPGIAVALESVRKTGSTVIELWDGATWREGDLSSLPAGGVAAAFADGPGDLTLGGWDQAKSTGYLAQGDGSTWTLAADGWDRVPIQLSRGPDGTLYVVLDDVEGESGLATWDGTALRLIDGAPSDTRGLAFFDGVLFASAVEENAAGDHYGVLHKRGAYGNWARVLEGDGVLVITETAEGVLVGDGDSAWHVTGCP